MSNNDLAELDYAIRTGNFTMQMVVFSECSPNIFHIENPQRKLELPLNHKKRAIIVNKFLGDLNPASFCSVYNLGYSYIHGIGTIPNRETREIKRMLEWDAVAHQLSRVLPVDAEQVKAMVLKKFQQGFLEILFIKNSNANGILELPNDKWKIVTKRPTTDSCFVGYNKAAKKLGIDWRIRTSQTYTIKTYNG